MSNEKNINTNVEKKDATAVAHEIKGELTYEDKVIQKNHWSVTRKRFQVFLGNRRWFLLKS